MFRCCSSDQNIHISERYRLHIQFHCCCTALMIENWKKSNVEWQKGYVKSGMDSFFIRYRYRKKIPIPFQYLCKFENFIWVVELFSLFTSNFMQSISFLQKNASTFIPLRGIWITFDNLVKNAPQTLLLIPIHVLNPQFDRKREKSIQLTPNIGEHSTYPADKLFAKFLPSAVSIGFKFCRRSRRIKLTRSWRRSFLLATRIIVTCGIDFFTSRCHWESVRNSK